MTTLVSGTKRSAPPATTETATAGAPTGAFDASLRIEQADALLRRTDQYAQWQRIRHANEAQAQRLAELVIQRDALLNNQDKESSINWQAIDQLTSQLRQAGILLPTSSAPSPHTTTALPATPPSRHTAAKAPRPSHDGSMLVEENQLILTLKGAAAGIEQTVFAYGDGSAMQLPLSEVARALDFNIQVDAQNGQATGWFLSENRTFHLDAAKRTVTVNGTSFPWDDRRISVGDGDIFIDSQLLTAWFPIDFDASLGELTVNLHPREQLPQQARLEREQQRAGLTGNKDLPLKHPLTHSPYDNVSMPVADIALSSGLETTHGNGDKGLHFSHSIQAEGDLARMGAKVFVSGQEEDALETARIKLERIDHGADLLGPLHARQMALGDITPTALPGLNRPGVERGLAVTNATVKRSRDFDTTSFEGNMLPGWDVELYQNGNLIQSARTGTDGRYRFEDVPVYFGPNTFQLLGHGPQGQRRVIEEKTINVGTGMLAPGMFEYSLSASQRRDTVLGLDHYRDEEHAHGARLNGAFGYGLNKHLSLLGGVSSLTLDDTQHTYLQAGLGGSVASFYGELDTIGDTAGGSGVALYAQTNLGPVNLRAKHEAFSDFIDESDPDRFLESRSSLGINGRVEPATFLPPLSLTLSREETVYEDRETGRTSARVSGQIKRLQVTNALHWNDRADTADSRAPVDGEVQLSGPWGRGRLSMGLGYELNGDDDFNRLSLSGLWPLDKGISAGGSLLRDDDDQKTTARAFLNLDTGKAILTPSLSCDSEGNVGAFLTLSFSLGQDPVDNDLLMRSEKRTGKGGAAAFVYHDGNNNRIFDGNDTPLSGVNVLAPQAGRRAVTTDSGMAQLTDLAAHEPTDIEIDPDSLHDPFMQPAKPGVALMPRSGKVQRLELPVITTGEIDGTVAVAPPGGGKQPLAGVRLELRDDSGAVIKTAISEHDGFYLLDKVPPGSYTLGLAADNPRLRNLERHAERPVVIGNDGTILRGNSFLLRPQPQSPNAEQAPPATLPVAASTTSRSVASPPFTIHPLEVTDQSALQSRHRALPPQPSAVAADSLSPAESPHQQAPLPAARLYTVQLASFASLESAKAGKRLLSDRLAGIIPPSDLSIVRVDLADKGTWYRVTCGQFAQRAAADNLATLTRRRIGQVISTVVQGEIMASEREEQMPRQSRGALHLSAAAVAGKYAAMQRAR